MTSKTSLMKQQAFEPRASSLRPEPTKPNSLFIGQPIAYHISTHTQICKCCSSYHSQTQVSLSIVGPRTRIFRTVGKFEYNLPILTHYNEPEYIPGCALCAPRIVLSHLPLPPSAPKALPSEVRAKWRVEAGKLVPREEGKKSPISSDDLF